MMKITTFDTTLRDGAQSEKVLFSVNDKLRIVILLDKLGIDFIEVGNPVFNGAEADFLEKLKGIKLSRSKLVMFGSTRKAGIKCEDSPVLNCLGSPDSPEYCSVFGKAWSLHVRDVLRTTEEENLNMIRESVEFLVSRGKKVFFDAEHFFDGYINDSEYAMKTVCAAVEAGCHVVILCDTNGGTFPDKIERITAEGAKHCSVPVGIHCHNDTGLAVASTMSAVTAGAEIIQGTLNGIGERCGNTNLSTVIANLQLKSGFDLLGQRIALLSRISRSVAQITNINTDGMPYVSRNAFAHKAGMHADAVLKNPHTFEHIDPATVGNKRNLLISEMSGKSIIYPYVHRIDPTVEKDSPVMDRILATIKQKESEGYRYEEAQASLDLLIKKHLGLFKPHFTIEKFKLIAEQSTADSPDGCNYAFIKVSVDDTIEIAATESDGPVHALDEVMKKALHVIYPSLSDTRLTDYKVRVLDSRSSTGGKVRVYIESTDGHETWGTVGVSTDIIEASKTALADAVEYKLDMEEQA